MTELTPLQSIRPSDKVILRCSSPYTLDEVAIVDRITKKITDTIGMSDYYSPNNGHSFKGQYHGVSILDGLFFKSNLVWVA